MFRILGQWRDFTLRPYSTSTSPKRVQLHRQAKNNYKMSSEPDPKLESLETRLIIEVIVFLFIFLWLLALILYQIFSRRGIFFLPAESLYTVNRCLCDVGIIILLVILAFLTVCALGKTQVRWDQLYMMELLHNSNFQPKDTDSTFMEDIYYIFAPVPPPAPPGPPELSFHIFQRLPKEIQLLIWDIAVQDEKSEAICIRGRDTMYQLLSSKPAKFNIIYRLSPLLHTTFDARRAVRRQCSPSFSKELGYPVYFNPQKDSLAFVNTNALDHFMNNRQETAPADLLKVTRVWFAVDIWTLSETLEDIFSLFPNLVEVRFVRSESVEMWDLEDGYFGNERGLPCLKKSVDVLEELGISKEDAKEDHEALGVKRKVWKLPVFKGGLLDHWKKEMASGEGDKWGYEVNKKMSRFRKRRKVVVDGESGPLKFWVRSEI